MLLSYKPLHLEAQQRLQEEGCVVDISDHNLSDTKLVSSSCHLLLRCFTGYDSIVAGLGGGVGAGASVGVGVGVGATAATMQPHLVFVQVIEIVICYLDGSSTRCAEHPASAWVEMFPTQQL